MQEYGRQNGDGSAQALLGPALVVEGKLTFEGQVRIDGKFTGEINTTGGLVIGETAKVSAEIACGTIAVHGEVKGNIRATEWVELHKPARVTGDIATPSLSVDRGAFFDGQSLMGAAGADVLSLNRQNGARKHRGGRVLEPTEA